MKKMKRLAALFLAVVMVMAMGMTAMAAPTIKVSNTVENATYKLYKIFDVTKAEDADATNGYNYSIPTDSVIATAPGFTDIFDVKGESTKYVTLISGKNATDIANLLNGLGEEYLGTPVATETATSGNRTIEFKNVTTDGYYYVRSTDANMNAVAMLDTAITGNQPLTITAKNDLPSWGDGGKTVDGEKTYNIGETIHYTLSYENALNYANGKLIESYTIKDTPVKATDIEIQKNTINITVGDVAVVTNGSPVVADNVTGLGADIDVKAGFEIGLKWGKIADDNLTDEFIYGSDVPKIITVTYDAIVLPTATTGNTGIENKATVTYKTADGDGTPQEETETVYTGQITIDKYKTGEEATKLKATFVIATDADATNYLVYNANAAEGTSKYSTTTDIKAATKYITGEKAEGDPEGAVYGLLGGVSINGLKAGKYYLKEIEAPEGYNLLEAPILVELSESKAVVDAEGNPTTDPEGNAVVEVYMTDTAKVANSTGTILPSTGGIGTTIFYVVGGILVLGAAVLLITKKRMSARN